jgi:hypothetical protein
VFLLARLIYFRIERLLQRETFKYQTVHPFPLAIAKLAIRHELLTKWMSAHCDQYWDGVSKTCTNSAKGARE